MPVIVGFGCICTWTCTLFAEFDVKSKIIDVKEPKEYDVSLDTQIEILKVSEPGKRDAGVIVETVEELVDKLKNEAGVIWQLYFLLNMLMAKLMIKV